MNLDKGENIYVCVCVYLFINPRWAISVWSEWPPMHSNNQRQLIGAQVVRQSRVESRAVGDRIDVRDSRESILWAFSKKADQKTQSGGTKVLIRASDREQRKDQVWARLSVRVCVQNQTQRQTRSRENCGKPR